MKSVELILLIITYSAIIIAIFISWICYKRNIEKWETIAFSCSLLLLIISMTIPLIAEENNSEEATNVFMLISMVIVGLTTPLSVLAERQHKISPFFIKLLYATFIFLFLSTFLGYFIDKLVYLESPIVIFLGLSVVFSMVLIRMTKPQNHVAHLEKSNRIFAILFLVFVPLSLLVNYAFPDMANQLRIGFTLPLVFILLSLNKIIDDLQRLSLINRTINPTAQHFKNYSLSEREKTVATLLVKGKTYKQISEELFISIPTVKTHSSNIYKKCNVKSRHELTLLIIN